MTETTYTVVTFRSHDAEYDCRELAWNGGSAYEAVLSVACPTCYASGGRSCSTGAGNETAFHAKRKARAVKLGRYAK